jgi:hypothetical protein|tara:strand:+ start:2563 stop:3510 length:948 start_codon:yes stop_codon:yes gene_type:complete
MKTLNEQYQLIKDNKGNKSSFLKEARRLYPKFVRNGANFKEVSTILKQKSIINENFVGLGAINDPIEKRHKEPYELAFESFLQEAETKAEEKKVSKEVEEDYSKIYDQRDKKNPDNMIFGQIQMGYYYEMKDPKNVDKTEQEIKEIVYKNLEKDPIYYTKNGQFGVEVGYTDDVPSLGTPEEPKGKYKESGYGDIKGESKFDYVVKENKMKKKKILKEHIHAMGIVTGGSWKAPTLAELLGEITDEEVETQKEYNVELEKTVELSKEAGLEEDMQAPYYMSELADAAEEVYDQGGLSVDEIVDFVQQHLGGKYGR